MNRKNIIIQLAIVLAIILVANLISNELYFRLDFTEDDRYTFSEATKDVVEEVDGVITITAYFSEDLPPQLMSNKQDFQDQLVEYENLSGGNVVYEFVNPNESEEKEREAQQNGIRPVMINVTERDQVQQMRAYMGAVLKMDDRSEIIPLIQPGAAMEYAITTAIKKVSIADKPKVGLIQGNGEPTLQALPQLQEELSVLYDVEPFQLNDTSVVPSYYRSLVWINPQDSLNPRNFAKLDRYLEQGGGLFVAHSAVEGDLQQGLLSKSTDVGLIGWLSQKGISIGQQFVIDAQCATVNVQQRQGFFTINSQVEFPYFPISLMSIILRTMPSPRALRRLLFRLSARSVSIMRILPGHRFRWFILLRSLDWSARPHTLMFKRNGKTAIFLLANKYSLQHCKRVPPDLLWSPTELFV